MFYALIFLGGGVLLGNLGYCRRWTAQLILLAVLCDVALCIAQGAWLGAIVLLPGLAFWATVIGSTHDDRARSFSRHPSNTKPPA